MAQYRITYSDDRAVEVVEADRVTVVESSGQIVLHREVMIMNRSREIVVRRLAGSDVRSVTEAGASR